MVSKKKSNRKSKKSVGRNATPAKQIKKQPKKKRVPKKSVKKTAAPSKTVTKKLSRKKTISGNTERADNKRTRNNRDSSAFARETAGSAGQSGDLQGLSNVESADSESVDELMEEGNAFEAGVVAGVEEAGERDEREVRTREVPEDDVPGEYLDEE